MSGRIFQNVVLQFKETTDRTIGVIDSEGTVIACSELTGIGKKWTKYVEPIAAAEGNCVTMEGKTFKAMPGWGTHFDYAVFTSGDDSVGRTVCSMACVALNAAKVYYEEKHDKGSFIKNIISDNILISDIYMRAKELRVVADVPRGVFVVRTLKKGESVPTDVIQSLFPDRQNDFVLSIGEGDVVLIRQMPEGSGINGFTMFLRTIPYNYYAVLTVVMSLFLIFTGAEFGPMKLNEDNAKNGDLFTTTDRPYGDDVDAGDDANGHVIDLLAPVLVLIAACIFGMVYTGGFFEGVDFITAFADCNASAGLVLGSSIALLFTFVFYRVRSVMTFQDFAACIPEGFKAMVSPMLILTLAWTLSGMTNLLGAKYYVANLLGGSAAALQYLLPVIIFLVAVFLAFATGTSWGTMGILIPVVVPVFAGSPLLPMAVAAVCAGAVMGDHCSPISDTTLLSATASGCDNLDHVRTQLPYALIAAGASAVGFLIAPMFNSPLPTLVISTAVMIVSFLILSKIKGEHIPQAAAELAPVSAESKQI